ncbi:IclR family transcriptional regulator domain-containing protein [Leucobacter sp. gxy201]|uniref:IclR family transcriptional regulator n=1 Tax=Leucobacter sp. gxy201 TaxID=2957200 RepID=UPI003DA0CB6E
MNDYTIESVRRAARVLDALMFEPGQTLQELSERIGLNKSTTFRLLFTLMQDDLVAQEADSKRYRLGPMTISLGQSAIESTSLIDVARPFMESLYARFHVVITLNMPSRDAVFEALRVPQFGRGEFIPAGTPLPYHGCASGQVFLAFSDASLFEHVVEKPLDKRASRTPTTQEQLEEAIARVQAKGWAMVHDTLEEGVTAAAAPVRGHRGDVVGALGSAAPSGALSESEWLELAAALAEAAANASVGLGAR